jgi:hypothetical protein
MIPPNHNRNLQKCRRPRALGVRSTAWSSAYARPMVTIGVAPRARSASGEPTWPRRSGGRQRRRRGRRRKRRGRRLHPHLGVSALGVASLPASSVSNTPRARPSAQRGTWRPLAMPGHNYAEGQAVGIYRDTSLPGINENRVHHIAVPLSSSKPLDV